jgi:predicted enzyme related to lactoylglutathione lyase
MFAQVADGAALGCRVMGTRTSHTPGTFSWVDLQTSDVDAAKAFYAELFGWGYDDMPMDDGSVYAMAKVGDDHVAALGGLPPGGVPPHWNSYVTVASADDALSRAGELGGATMGDAFDVFTAGRMGVLTDPTGAALAVWEPRDNVGAGRVNDVGCLTWNELGTTDPKAAADFFGQLFGWTYEEQDMGGGEPYRTIRNGDRMNGGIRRQGEMEAGVPPNWLPYFTVEDADATAAKVSEHGGQVLAPPMTLPTEGEPRIAVFADPQGAAFAVFAGPTED